MRIKNIYYVGKKLLEFSFTKNKILRNYEFYELSNETNLISFSFMACSGFIKNFFLLFVGLSALHCLLEKPSPSLNTVIRHAVMPRPYE